MNPYFKEYMRVKGLIEKDINNVKPYNFINWIQKKWRKFFTTKGIDKPPVVARYEKEFIEWLKKEKD